MSDNINWLCMWASIITILALGIGLSEAYAYTHIGIELSESCKALISVGDYETCYSYDYINYLYEGTKLKPSFQTLVDNAEQSERLKYQTNDIVLNHKTQCVTKDYCNIFELYPNQKTIFWYDPDDKFRGNLDIKITIHPRLLSKNIINTTESNAILYENGKRYATYEIKNLFIYSSCRTAEYDPQVLYKELGRIIYYMIEGCKDPKILGPIGDIYKAQIDKNDFNIGDSEQYKYYKWLKEAKDKCKQKC